MDNVMAQAMQEEDKARRTYYGDDAVIAAAKHYGFKGPIDPIARRIIHEEGFVNGTYLDSKGIPTEGIGVADPKLRGKPWFTEVLPIYQQQAQTATKGFEKLTTEQQGAITSMAYRGDWGKKTRGHLNKGNLKAAAKEYLDHNEYRKGKAKGATEAQKAISRRMLGNARDLDPEVKA